MYSFILVIVREFECYAYSGPNFWYSEASFGANNVNVRLDEIVVLLTKLLTSQQGPIYVLIAPAFV